MYAVNLGCFIPRIVIVFTLQSEPETLNRYLNEP